MFLHYHGEHGARLNRTESVHFNSEHISHEPSLLFEALNIIFFYNPQIYMQRFDEISVDGLTNATPWNELRDHMRKGWEATTTPVSDDFQHRDRTNILLQITVLLSANVALLAISSVDNNGNQSPHRSVAQVACYGSTILALACYLICWILSRRHPPDSMTTASEAVGIPVDNHKRSNADIF